MLFSIAPTLTVRTGGSLSTLDVPFKDVRKAEAFRRFG